MKNSQNQYYDQIHQRLAQEFFIPKEHVGLIRSFVLGRKWTRGQIILWARQKSEQKRVLPRKCDRGRRDHSRDYYLNLIAFVQKAGYEDWKGLTFPYKIIKSNY